MSVRLDALLRGRFVTFDARRPEVDALGVLDGRIVAVGDDATDASATRTIDLPGAVCFAGFHDAHAHSASFGSALGELDLSTPPITTLAELYDAVAERARHLPEGALIVGRGYDQNKLGGHPVRDALDVAGDGRPVWLQHTSGHMCVLSSAALDRVGPELGSPIEGGRVVRDDAGRPTGLLEERAQLLAQRLVRPRSVTEIAAHLSAAHEVYLREGLTSVCDAGVAGGWIGESPAELAAYQLLHDERWLGVRTTAMVAADVLHPMARHADDLATIGLDAGIRSGLGDEWLRVGALKVFADGSLIGRTCWLTSPFEDDPGNVGYPQGDPAALTERIVEAHLAGWQVATHAIGDAAVAHVLDAYEQALARKPVRDHRHRIEHCGVTTEDSLARIAALGVIPVPQARFVGELGDGMLAALGERRSHDTYRLRSFLDRGIVLPASSDRPVVDGRPLLGIADMVRRATESGQPFAPEEALDVEQAMRSYTVGSAFATRTERDLGTLELGKRADVVALTEDPRELREPDAIAAVGVVATIVGGMVGHGG